MADSHDNISFPVSRSTKRSLIPLAAPSKLFWFDLIISMDIHPNPGPSTTDLYSSFVVTQPSMARNLHTGNMSHRITYSKAQFFI